MPRDHFLRKVDKLVDFDFIYEKVAPYYCEIKGRPSADPRNVDETVDAKNGIIVGVATTPANVTDNVIHNNLVMKAIETFSFDTEAIAADSSFDSSEIYAEFYKHGIKTFIVPQKNKNVFELVDFSYNELADMYICPGGRQFGYFSYEKSRHLKIYHTKTGYDNCPKKNECAAKGKRTLNLDLHERERKAQRALFGTSECTEALSSGKCFVRLIFHVRRDPTILREQEKEVLQESTSNAS